MFSVSELVEKTHYSSSGNPTSASCVVGMNKARAYRQLQRRQGQHKLVTSKVWSEAASLTQSYDTSLKQTINRIRDNTGAAVSASTVTNGVNTAVSSAGVLINGNSHSGSSADNATAEHRNNSKNTAISSMVRAGINNINGSGFKTINMVESSKALQVSQMTHVVSSQPNLENS